MAGQVVDRASSTPAGGGQHQGCCSGMLLAKLGSRVPTEATGVPCAEDEVRAAQPSSLGQGVVQGINRLPSS